MTEERHIPTPIPEQPDRFGVHIDSALARRERLANRFDFAFGQERVFPEVIDVLLAAIPKGARVLEVGAAIGLLTRPLLTKAGVLTALEPSEGMLKRLLASETAIPDNLIARKGMVEDLRGEEMYDVAVVTFTPRRGLGLLSLLTSLAMHVKDKVLMLVDEEGTLDWAYVARSAAHQGFDVRMRFINPPDDEHHRVVFISAAVANWNPLVSAADDWATDAREVNVPFPAPRGTATRLVRYAQAGGDRALFIRTDPDGVERLYGNLRTAVHRLGRDELTVRRVDDGVQIVRLPRAGE